MKIDQEQSKRSDGMTWLGRMRLRLFATIIGVPLAVFGVLSIGPGWLTIPLVGVAIAAVTVTVNKTTNRIVGERCWTCGTSLHGEPAGEQGVVCPDCGSLNQFNPRHLALGDAPDESYDFTLEHDDVDDADEAKSA